MLTKIRAEQLSYNLGFEFQGCKRGMLSGFSDTSFEIREYRYMKDTITKEYSFNGTSVAQTTENIKPWYDVKPNQVLEIHGNIDEKEFYIDELYQDQSQFTNIFATVNAIEKTRCQGDDSFDQWIIGKVRLVRWSHGDTITFIVSHINECDADLIVSVAVVEEGNYTDGDSGTHVYCLDGKHILVWNDGDCRSVLMLKSLSGENLDPISKQQQVMVQELHTYHKLYNQSVVNFLHLFLPSTDFSLFEVDETEDKWLKLHGDHQWAMLHKRTKKVVLLVKVLRGMLKISVKSKEDAGACWIQTIYLEDICDDEASNFRDSLRIAGWI